MHRGDEMRTRSKGTKWAASLSILLLHQKGFREMGTKVGEGKRTKGQTKFRQNTDFRCEKRRTVRFKVLGLKLPSLRDSFFLCTLFEAHNLSDVCMHAINNRRILGSSFRRCYGAAQTCKRPGCRDRKTWHTSTEINTASKTESGRVRLLKSFCF